MKITKGELRIIIESILKEEGTSYSIPSDQEIVKTFFKVFEDFQESVNKTGDFLRGSIKPMLKVFGDRHEEIINEINEILREKGFIGNFYIHPAFPLTFYYFSDEISEAYEKGGGEAAANEIIDRYFELLRNSPEISNYVSNN